MTINNEYELGDIVYLKTDVEQLPRIVTTILVEESGLRYELTQRCTANIHFGIEISTTKNIMLTTTN